MDEQSLEEAVVRSAAFVREHMGNGLSEVKGEDDALTYLKAAHAFVDKMGWVNGSTIIKGCVDSYERSRRLRIEQYRGELRLD